MTALGVTVDGDGAAILFLHGIGSSRHSFAAQVNHFASAYRCIVPDAPGYGDSPDPQWGSDASIDHFAQAYEELLDKNLAGDPVIIVGVSFGGVVAATMALRIRVNIVGLVLSDTSRGSGVDPAKAAAMRLRSDELAALGAPEFSHRRAPRLVHNQDPTLIGHVTEIMAAAIRLPGYGLAAAAMADTDLTDRLSGITVPTLVTVGEHDQICPLSEARRIADAVKHGELAIVPNAGHLANLEQPDEFNNLIHPFIQRVHRAQPQKAATS